MIDLDPFLKDAVQKDTIPDFASPSDHFTTGGGLQFDFNDNPRRLRSGHVLDFKGATLELDPDRVTDAMLMTQMAIMMLGSEMGKLYGKTGLDAYNAISTGITVKNVRLVANYTKLAARAKALGLSAFSIAGCGLQGHDAHVDVTLSDFGSYGREGFPAWIVGVDNSFDSMALYNLDPSYLFDGNTPLSTIKYRFEDYNCDLASNQVTVGMVTGALCPGTFNANPWSMGGPWRHMWRRGVIMQPDVFVPPNRWNLVQGATAYQCLQATIDGKTDGAQIGYYSDYFQSRGVHILPTCSFMNGDYGAIIRLSPTAAEYPDLAQDFNAADFVIERFQSNARQWDVELQVNAMPDKSYPPGRYLKNFAIDERLRLNNIEGRADVHLIPAPDTKKGGCRFL